MNSKKRILVFISLHHSKKKTANKWIGEKTKHKRFKEFARGFVYFRVGDNGYSADEVVGTNTNGIAILYDLVNIVPQKITEATDTIQGNSQVSRRDASNTVDTTTPSSESQSPKSTKALMTTDRIDYLIEDSGAGIYIV